MCTFALTMSSRQAPAIHYNTRKISLYLVCCLFSHEALPKCRENYGDSFSVIYEVYDVTAKILVVSTIYVYTMNYITHQFILNSVQFDAFQGKNPFLCVVNEQLIV